MNLTDLTNSQNQQIISNKLIAYWSCNDGSGTIAKDYSSAASNNRDGTLVGSPVWKPGKVGPAIYYSGTNRITIPDNIIFTFSNGVADVPFSITLWTYWQGWNTSDSYPMAPLIDKMDNLVRMEWLVAIHTNGAIRVQMHDTVDIFIQSMTVPLVSQNIWYHYAMTYNASGAATGIKQYLTGSSVTCNSTTVPGYVTMDNGISPVATAQALYVGDTTYQGRFIGIIDDVRIYNKELSASEVLTLYNETK